MADESSSIPRPFDVRTIKYLVRLMSRHDLSEIDLREGELRIRLQRGGRVTTALPVAAPPVVAAGPVTAPPPIAPTPALDGAKSGKHLIEIKSPGPGTFYIAPNPGADPYVRKGSRVTPTSVVGLLEAMKLFTEINADCSGVIEEIVVENQQAVEYEQVLFRVDPTG
jgi:acetyl-CoA carboxylase biotin carboxyl carrier protein